MNAPSTNWVAWGIFVFSLLLTGVIAWWYLQKNSATSRPATTATTGGTTAPAPAGAGHAPAPHRAGLGGAFGFLLKCLGWAIVILAFTAFGMYGMKSPPSVPIRSSWAYSARHAPVALDRDLSHYCQKVPADAATYTAGTDWGEAIPVTQRGDSAFCTAPSPALKQFEAECKSTPGGDFGDCGGVIYEFRTKSTTGSPVELKVWTDDFRPQ